MKELIVVVGLPWSEKLKYTNMNYSNHQIVSPFYIKKSMEFTRVNKSDQSLYLILEVMVRSLMILQRPIVVIENSLELETIFIWKKMAVEHDYPIKVIIFDQPLEDCFSKADTRNKDTLKFVSMKSKKLEQLKHILSMEHQKIVDGLTVVKTSMEEKQDEILQS